MTDNKLKTHYKPNVVYELLIHSVYPYAGCHCSTKDSVYLSEIIYNSGNYLTVALKKELITWQEYKDCAELINVWEFDTKEEALDFEIQKIQELKEKYGDLCKNKALGNKLGSKGLPPYQRSEDIKRKISETLRGNRFYTNGVTNVYLKTCPEGFYPGLTRKKKNLTNYS